MIYSVVSYFHIVSIVGLFSSLIVELIFLKREMTMDRAKIVAKADLSFGIFAGLTAIFGLLNMFYFGKGTDYYLRNTLFIIKLSAFILVGLLSTYPTITFLKIRKHKEDIIHLKSQQAIKLIIIVEIALLIIIPFLGVLVANGWRG